MEEETTNLLDGLSWSSSSSRHRRRIHAAVGPAAALSTAQSTAIRRATSQLVDLSEHRSRQSMIDARQSLFQTALSRSESTTEYNAIDEERCLNDNNNDKQEKSSTQQEHNQSRVVNKISAVLLACMMNMMIAIPFGAAYFPIGWKSIGSVGANGPNVFPLQGKEALGIRMFLLPTFLGQLVVTWASKLDGISFQMVENVPFYHALAAVVIAEQGYGMDSLATLFFLFGLASVFVGAIFYALGALKMGRVVYFIPSHILLGCIGGIGIFVAVTGIQVTINETFSLFSVQDLINLWDKMNLFGVVVALEIMLRILTALNVDKEGRPRFTLLTPTFYCLITPLFYLGLLVTGVSVSRAQQLGYFFPVPPTTCNNAAAACSNPGYLGTIFNASLFDIWRVVDFRAISWRVVFKAIPTIVALAAFSIVHVPINIPAIAISMDMDPDMNTELVAHGYSNALSGLFAGLQNYITYSVSVVFKKNGGDGKATSLAVAAGSMLLFIFGPSLAIHIPRCMAGTLLFHIGLDLFLEGVYDSYGNYDLIEYGGIWLITIVMTAQGMTAALIAGIIAALSTYAVQSITHHYPIRGVMTAESLRSSRWTRSQAAVAILDDETWGRKRILVLQLQGHLFFGNITQLTDHVRRLLLEKSGNGEAPLVVIFDFGLVIGMDSSAAHAVVKLKRALHKVFDVEVVIFVTGSGDGFPCEYALSQELSGSSDGVQHAVDWSEMTMQQNGDLDQSVRSGAISVSRASSSMRASLSLPPSAANRVYESLDAALMFAEEVLIARKNPVLLSVEKSLDDGVGNDKALSPKESAVVARQMLANLCPKGLPTDVDFLFSKLVCVEYSKDDVVWQQGSPGTCALLLVAGSLRSTIENTDATEIVNNGSMLGELGLVHGMNRLSTVTCLSERAVCYRLGAREWKELTTHHPKIARLVDEIVIYYLTHRVQHVSNRIFETRCLPI